jgi:hypothetical protein
MHTRAMHAWKNYAGMKKLCRHGKIMQALTIHA